MQKFFDCGIDLGTTNSCLAISDNNHGFEIIENQADRMSVTPSAIMINGKGRMLVGQRAYNSQKTEDLAIQFKRQMGTNRMVHFSSANIDKTPEELSAEILKKLRSDAEARLNFAVENVVITVPAAFKTLQSEATNKAGQMAGFKNIILLQEPIAAAVAYGARPNSKNKYWMVFDYGGGTLDVAIISTANGRLTVCNSEGNNYFGGSDIDRLILWKIVIPKLKEQGYAVDEVLSEATTSGKSLLRKLQLDCENCKIALSSSDSSIIELFDIDDDNGDCIEFECTVTRAELESLIADTVEDSITIAKKALEGAKLNASQLDKILLVGGSTFIPLVRRRLEEEFGVPLDSSLNPMTVVAAGAAIYASGSVLDVEEDVSSAEKGQATISLTYDPISSEQKVNVIGKIADFGGTAPKKVKIDGSLSTQFSGVCWTSGWTEFLEETSGIFDIDVLLQKGKMNYFRVVFADEFGSEVPITNCDFTIKHNENVLRNSAPPATASIGVEIANVNTGYSMVHHVIKKNAELPARAEQTYKLSRDIDPSSDTVIRIKIWEGENVNNPEANFPAGEITIQACAMDRFVPKGTAVELTIIAEENRNIRVSGYIPDLDYIIPEETLRPETHVDWGERLDSVDKKIEQAEVSIRQMKDQGVDVSELENSLCEIRRDYNEASSKVESDEAYVSSYVDRFYDLETKVIEQERQTTVKKNSTKDDEKVKNGVNNVESWGSDQEKAEVHALQSAYNRSDDEEERSFIAEKIDTLGFEVMTNNFNWLRGFFTVVLADSEKVYSNPQKAEYWKSQAYQAIDSQNRSQLRKAVFELLDILTSGSSQAISHYTADLTL